MKRKKLVRITTIPISLEKLLTGQLHFMNNFYEVIAVSSEKVKLEEYVKKEGVSGYCVEMTRKITPFKDLTAIWKLYVFLKKEKPFMVHSHTPKAGLVGMLAAKLAGVPNRWHTVAGLPLLEATGFKRSILDFVEKIIYACATKVLPNSSGLKEIIIENKYCKTEKLSIIGQGSSNGIDTAYFNPDFYADVEKDALRNELGIKKSDFVFIFVGRLVSDKGINELVKAFVSLREKEQNVKLLLVGGFEGDLDPLLPTTIEVLGKNDSIIQAGFQNDVRPFFSISDALVFPSYREGFPNVVMQAGAMGLPSIVTDINGCNEIITEKVNGLIIPVKNEFAIYDAMNKLCTIPLLKEELSDKARDIIVNKYNRQTIWESLLEEYKKA
ncbi:glycosyltransferase family 4 protein [Flavobacterium sp. GCM10023249]|uniref:glycosyltransferase family 4 protein n=1 Tax=unclassified Flavobacterium TaxID=196869 RepID=UPI00362332FE